MITDREKAIWKAAITLAHNMCVQASDRINEDDGPMGEVDTLSKQALLIRGWLEPTDAQLDEMFAEAGVPGPNAAQALAYSELMPGSYLRSLQDVDMGHMNLQKWILPKGTIAMFVSSSSVLGTLVRLEPPIGHHSHVYVNLRNWEVIPALKCGSPPA